MILRNQLKERLLPEGGFSAISGGGYRTDATCWAILALSGDPEFNNPIDRSRNRLAVDQFPDGRVSISTDHPEAIWPTSLAILAWHQSSVYRQNLDRAADFLISTTGSHWQRPADSPLAHDSSIKGWPWIAETHSWVEPTALAILALKIAGYGTHNRVKEAAHLLLDRQLPHGGWNYGNTIVFGQEQRPMPLSTGMALNALKDDTEPETIQRSLIYLQSRTPGLQTPRSVGWSLLGLGAWHACREPCRPTVDECIKNQTKYGTYDTASLSLLQIALKTTGGLEGIFSNTGNP